MEYSSLGAMGKVASQMWETSASVVLAEAVWVEQGAGRGHPGFDSELFLPPPGPPVQKVPSSCLGRLSWHKELH